jgi:hypothetical protein
MPTRAEVRRAQRFHRLDANLTPPLTRRLQRFFSDQAARVLHRFLLAIPAANWDRATKDIEEMPVVPPTAEEILPHEEQGMLWLALIPFLYQATVNSGNLAGELVGVGVFASQDPRIYELLKDAGSRVAGIHRTTLEAIRATLAEGVQRGYSMRQIAYGVPEDEFRGLRAVITESYKGRALTIATNEIANARAMAAAERFQEAGVSMVYIMDGPGCGWFSHSGGDVANGSRRTLIEYRQTPYSHINCVRVGLPIMGR